MVVRARPVLGEELDVTIFHRIKRTTGDAACVLRGGFAHRNEPLIGEHWFHDLTGAFAHRHHALVRHRFFQKALRSEVFEHHLAAFKAIESDVLFRAVLVDLGVERKDRDQRNVVTQRAGVVVKVMRAGDLDAAGAEIAIHKIICDDRDFAITQWQVHHLADEMFVALVLRMNSQRAVGEHRLWASGGDVHADHRFAVCIELRAVRKRVQDVPHETVALDRFNFKIGHGGLQHRIPMHQAFAAINQPLFEQRDERFDHAFRHVRIHREVTLIALGIVSKAPVRGRAETTHLLRDGGAGRLLPFPHAFGEFFATEIVPRLAFGLQLLLDHNLCGDAGVVGADDPVRVVALHAVIANERVHQRLLECMSHVQHTGHVGRRQLNGVTRLRRVAARFEITRLLPDWIPLFLDVLRFERLGERVEGALSGLR